MLRKYRNYTDQDIIRIAAEVTSMAQLLKKLGLKATGGNYANIRKALQRLNLNCEHWTGQGWSKDQQLKDWSGYSKIEALKPHLIKKRGHQCERCELKTWQGKPITLEVDHVNGDRTDNREENLKLYCPNCHALTPTWRGRKDICDDICPESALRQLVKDGQDLKMGY